MKKNSVAIIDYGAGNLASVRSAVNFVGGNAEIVSKPSDLLRFSSIILPGVGSFRVAMQSLQETGFAAELQSIFHTGETKILGICLGMQLLAEQSSEDGETSGLGFIRGSVERFNIESDGVKVPHIGFSPVVAHGESQLLKGLGSNPDFYFVHSYKLPIPQSSFVGGVTEYAGPFLSTIESGRLFATQFHPEKSQTNGLVLLKNFFEID